MQHVNAVPFEGDSAAVFDWALGVLTPMGFQVVEKTASSLEVTGPGLNSSRQSAMLGASRIRLASKGGELTLEAELGGVQRLARFVAIFPQALCLGMGLVFFLVFGVVLQQGGWVIPVVVAVGANAVLWLILAPVVIRRFRSRTCLALDALLHNTAAVGKGR